MFDPGKPFQPSLMFVGEVRGLPKSGAPEIQCYKPSMLQSNKLDCLSITIIFNWSNVSEHCLERNIRVRFHTRPSSSLNSKHMSDLKISSRTNSLAYISGASVTKKESFHIVDSTIAKVIELFI